MNSRVLAAIAAAVLAILGIGAAALYASSANTRALDGARMVTVYEVTREIPADTDAAALGDGVKQSQLPQSAVADGIVTDLAQIAGQKSTVALLPGEQLLKARFSPDGSAGSGGSSAIPKGLQQVSIQMDPATAGGTTVKEGTRVGLIVTLTPEAAEGDSAVPLSRMFLQKILVTGVSGSAAGGGGIVTFAVTGTQATQITAAAAQGQIRLTAQNAQTDADGGKPVDARTLVK